MQQTQTATITAGDITITAPSEIIMRSVLAELAGAANDATTKIIATPTVGEYWPEEGGVVAGIMRGEGNQPNYYLIFPTDPLASNNLPWGGQGKDEPGATNMRDGLKNTQALVASKYKHPAAEWADGLTIGKHSDLYLPAHHELRLAQINVPELFEKEWYLSSTQFSADFAYVQYFDDGSQLITHKGYDYRVRAVRRVLIIQ